MEECRLGTSLQHTQREGGCHRVQVRVRVNPAIQQGGEELSIYLSVYLYVYLSDLSIQFLTLYIYIHVYIY